VGVGSGPGVGEGHGGGTGGGAYHVGGGVSAPRVLFDPSPEYSEEARKAKFQGTSVVSLIVGPDGLPRDIHISRSLGLGLDEKAIEAVKQWKFAPAEKDGKAVAVEISVEVDFHLY
jgi:protein TonB